MQVAQRSYHVNESVVAAELDNEMVLLNVENGIYFGLDAVGTMIWSKLVAEESEETIIQQLTDEYDVDPEQVRADVVEFLSLLQTKELIYLRES